MLQQGIFTLAGWNFKNPISVWLIAPPKFLSHIVSSLSRFIRFHHMNLLVDIHPKTQDSYIISRAPFLHRSCLSRTLPYILAILAFLTSKHCLCTSDIGTENEFSLSKLQSRNSLQVESGGGYKAHLISFPSLKGHSSALLVI